MNTEQLQKGKELVQEIENTEKTLKMWNEATKFRDNMILIDPGSYWVWVNPESFTVLRAINVQHFTEKLEKLQTEFSAL